MKDTSFEITKNSKSDGQRGLTYMVYTAFDKEPRSRVSVNEELAQELHKPSIKKFKRREVYAWFNLTVVLTKIPKIKNTVCQISIDTFFQQDFLNFLY